MKKDYQSEKEDNKRSTKTGMAFLVIFIILFLIVILRVAVRSGLKETYFTSMPSGKDAFEIAKDYIRPTLNAKDVQFSDSTFQYTKRPDSVYEIRSYFEAKTSVNNNENVKTNFFIILKYKGGANLNDHNWTVLTFQEQ